MKIKIVHEYYEGGTEMHCLIHIKEDDEMAVPRLVGRMQLDGRLWPEFKALMAKQPDVILTPGFN